MGVYGEISHCLSDPTEQKWTIFIMGVYGEISHFLSDPTEFFPGYIKKTLTHIMKVSVRNNK